MRVVPRSESGTGRATTISIHVTCHVRPPPEYPTLGGTDSRGRAGACSPRAGDGGARANPLELDIHVHHICKVEATGYFKAPSRWLNQFDNAKRHRYEGVCHALGHSFLPVGFTAWGAMSSGTTEFLEKVADAAHEQGYVGEAWGTLKGDRIRAMHGLYMGVSYALNKSVAIQLDVAQMRANRAYVTSKAHARRAFYPPPTCRRQPDRMNVVRGGSAAAVAVATARAPATPALATFSTLIGAVLAAPGQS